MEICFLLGSLTTLLGVVVGKSLSTQNGTPNYSNPLLKAKNMVKEALSDKEDEILK